MKIGYPVKLALPTSIRHNSTDSLPTSDLVCIKMASILNTQARYLKHGGAFSNHCEVVFLRFFLARLKDHLKSLVCNFKYK